MSWFTELKIVVKELLYNFLDWLFKDQLENRDSVQFNLGIKKGREDVYSDRDFAELVEMKELLGKPVICHSNEWENPVIGFATNIQYITKAQNPVLIVKDYLSGEELMVMSKVFLYSRTRLDAFLKLTPYEAISLIYPNHEISTSKPKRAHRHTAKTIHAKLEASGFGEELNKYYTLQLERIAFSTGAHTTTEKEEVKCII